PSIGNLQKLQNSLIVGNINSFAGYQDWRAHLLLNLRLCKERNAMTDQDRTQKLLHRFGEYLTFIARLQTAGRSKAKLDVSGVVQQTLLEAHKAMEQLVSLSEDRQAAWLRQALSNNLADELRKLSAQKRDVRHEQSLDASLDHSMARLGRILPAD